MNLFLLIIYVGIISAWIIYDKKFLPEGIRKGFLLSYFGLKCICGYLVYLIYQNYYSGKGDVFIYIQETEILYNYLKLHPANILNILTGHSSDLNSLELWNNASYNSFYNDNRSLLLYNVIVRFFSAGFVPIHIIWMNIPSYLGLILLYKVFSRDLDLKPGLLSMLPFFLPDVLVFGSAYMKEPLMIFSLGFFLRSIQLFFINQNLKSTFVLLLSIFMFLFIKTYLLLIFLPGILAWKLSMIYPKKSRILIFSGVYFGGLLIILFLGMFLPVLSLPAFLAGQQLSNIRNAVFSGTNTYLSPVLFAPTIYSFLKRIPEALVFGFFRPWPFEVSKWWMIPLAVEPVVLSVILLWCFFKIKLLKINMDSISLLCMFSAIVLIILIGFTTPVAGNLVRYKMPALLLFMLSITKSLYGRINLR